ncbi:MAG TPA: glycosyltransferase [Burkholderiales bacterium]|nr:glycosyltransferase [Burkholderiales bacterium]
MSRSDAGGGAARASHQLHCALRADGHASRMSVGVKRSADRAVMGPSGALAAAWSVARPGLASVLMRLQRAPDGAWRSLAAFPSGLDRAINRCEADVVNLHWIGDETMSVEEIGRITKPVVWTMHDMWPFCGAEHYAADDACARWRGGYAPRAKQAGIVGLDLDAWVWRRKRNAWRPFQLVAPSRWLADCARSSALMQGWPISVVPYVVDADVFRPRDDATTRAEWNLPAGAPLLLFGAASGTRDRRKGWDLLVAALDVLAPARRDVVCVVLGEKEPVPPPRLPVPVRWLGRVADDEALARLYAMADVTVVPSRQDNLPLFAIEAQACGCPVVAFATSGLPDAIEHRVTGYLAEPFAPADLARGILWVLADKQRHRQLRAQARERAERLWSPSAVAGQYLEVYAAAIETHRARTVR